MYLQGFVVKDVIELCTMYELLSLVDVPQLVKATKKESQLIKSTRVKSIWLNFPSGLVFPEGFLVKNPMYVLSIHYLNSPNGLLSSPKKSLQVKLLCLWVI